MNRYYPLLIAATLLGGCHGDAPKQDVTADLFEPVKADFTTTTVNLPKGMKADILFAEATDSVLTTSGQKLPSLGYADFIAYIPSNGSSDSGYLYVNHELDDWNADFKDAGGGSIIPIKKENGTWKRNGDARAVDFSAVGGTTRNCGGTVTPYGTILCTEEVTFASNADMQKHIPDTTDFGGRKKYQNFGWVVEIDPKTAKATRKLFQMGHFDHEGITVDPDGKTLYITNDANPCVFYKFVADSPTDYSKGQLYAFQEGANGSAGQWLKMPMDMDSLLDARNVAMRMGASMYVRHEWLTEVNGKVYINETGLDDFDWSPYVAMGGKPAAHIMGRKTAENKFAEPYGCVLVFDPATNTMKELLAGGTAAGDSSTNLSNPDCISHLVKDGKAYLVLHEDINATSLNRVGQAANGATYNEIYFLDLSIPSPTVKDLKRLMAAPKGCETSGGAFAPDGSTYFVSIQHPDTNNPAPYNKSTVIAVTGFK